MKRELGIFERAQVIADQYAPFHIVGVLRLENAPPPHLVKRSLTVLRKRHPFLSMRLMHEGGRYYFMPMSEPSLPFHTLPRWNDEHWIQVVETELASRVDAFTGPMFRCTYLYGASQPHAEIVFTLSHFIADAASASHLLHELMTICVSFADGVPVSVSRLSPAPTLESRFPPAFKGWWMTLRTMCYVLAQMVDEIVYRIRTIGKRIPHVPSEKSLGRILSLRFSEDEIEPFAQRARKEGVTLNSALNAALLLAVNRRLYFGKKLPMRTFSFADLRPYVDPPLHAENLGLYISMMRYTVDVKGDADLWSLAGDLHRKIYSSLKSGDKFIAAGMSESMLKMLTRFKTIRTCASALNYSGAVPVQPRYGNFKVLELHGFVSAFDFGPEMASQAQMFNNSLFWDFVYMNADMNDVIAKAVVDEIREIMVSAANK